MEQFGVDVTETSLTQLVQRSWQIEDGLPQNTVAAIEQTPDGYVWFGTEEGLVRFNGLEFAIFDDGSVDAFGLNQSVRALEVRKDGSLWIGTDGGGLLVFRDGEIVAAPRTGLTNPNQITSLYEDRAGTLWIGTFEDGLWMITSGQEKPRQVFAGKTVRGISEDSIGNLYVGTLDGIVRVNQAGETEPFGKRFGQANSLQNVFVDRLDRIWYSTREGTFRMDDPLVEVNISDTPAPSFLQDRQGHVWVGLDGEGLLRIGDMREALTTRDGLTHGRIVALHEDREGSIWVGTEGGGIFQLTTGEFVNYGLREGLLSEMVLTVEAASDGSVWAGTEGGGLYQFTSGELKHYGKENGLSDDIVTSLAADNGTMWVGTFYGGLNRVDHRGILHFGADEGLPVGVVGAIEIGIDGSIWVGTDGGLSRIKGSEITTFTTDDGLGSNYLTAITQDRSGSLWIGTYAGLYVYDGVSIRAAETQPDKTILSISEDSEGLLWVTTLHNGVHIKDGNTWYQFGRRHGLPSNSIYQAVFDSEGMVWFTSNLGLFVGSRQNILNAVRTDGVVDIVTKTESDGLRSTEFNGGVQPAGAMDSNGRLWFPSLRGLASISPEFVKVEGAGPSVAIEGIEINGSAARERYADGVLSLAAGQKKLEIRASAITFRSPEKVVVEYMLDGQDDAWGRAGTGQRITYTNLSPGTYTLRLRAVTDDGIKRFGPETTMTVVLDAYMYERPGFWIVLAIVLALVVLAIHRFQVRSVTRRERKKNLELEHIVVQRTKELKQLNDHLAEKVQDQVRILMSERSKYETKLIDARDRAMESDRLKSTIISNLGHEFRTPITSILGFTDVIAEKLQEEDLEFASYIKQGAQRLLDTLTSLIDLSELEAEAVRHVSVPVSAADVAIDAVSGYDSFARHKGLTINTICPPTPIIATLDPQLLHKAISAIVNNAVKYTEEGSVTISITESDDHVLISIADTGIGISESFMPDLFSAFKQESNGVSRSYEGCGLGLTVAQRLVDLMCGSIQVKSIPGVGSEFTMRIPMHDTRAGAGRSRDNPVSEAA